MRYGDNHIIRAVSQRQEHIVTHVHVRLLLLIIVLACALSACTAAPAAQHTPNCRRYGLCSGSFSPHQPAQAAAGIECQDAQHLQLRPAGISGGACSVHN